MKLAIVGATRGIGRQAIEAALARGHEVVAIARSPDAIDVRHPKLSVVQGDALVEGTLDGAMKGADALLCALGSLDRSSKVRSVGTKNALAAAAKAGVKKVAVVSAIGVGDSYAQCQQSSFVFGRIIMPLLLKGPFADMAVMEEAVRQSGLEWTIVRPTGLTNKPAKGAVKAIGAEDGKVGSWISRADVARFLVEAVETGSHAGRALSVYSA